MNDDLSQILKEKTNARIIWYLRESGRKYSNILNHLGERDSGKVNYHLKKLIKEGLIKKNNILYELTKKGVKYALYVDSLQLKEKYPLPVVLVALFQNDKILLAKRCRDPCNGLWGLPGNEILYGESPLESAEKEVERELKIECIAKNISGVYPTVYYEDDELLYHVMLFVVKCDLRGDISLSGKASGKIEEYQFFSIDEIESLKIIPSNKQPISDSFSKSKCIKNQVLFS